MPRSTASAATAVPKASCKRIDPNLVRGLCLRYVARSGVGYTWIGIILIIVGLLFGGFRRGSWY